MSWPSALQPSFDALDTLPKVCDLLSQAFDRRGIGDPADGPVPQRDISKVVVWETEGPRERSERRTGALTVLALLDLTQRGHGDAGLLREFPLRHPPVLHPVVDNSCDGDPIAHITLLTSG